MLKSTHSFFIIQTCHELSEDPSYCVFSGHPESLSLVLLKRAGFSVELLDFSKVDPFLTHHSNNVLALPRAGPLYSDKTFQLDVNHISIYLLNRGFQLSQRFCQLPYLSPTECIFPSTEREQHSIVCTHNWQRNCVLSVDAVSGLDRSCSSVRALCYQWATGERAVIVNLLIIPPNRPSVLWVLQPRTCPGRLRLVTRITRKQNLGLLFNMSYFMHMQVLLCKSISNICLNMVLSFLQHLLKF